MRLFILVLVLSYGVIGECQRSSQTSRNVNKPLPPDGTFVLNVGIPQGSGESLQCVSSQAPGALQKIQVMTHTTNYNSHSGLFEGEYTFSFIDNGGKAFTSVDGNGQAAAFGPFTFQELEEAHIDVGGNKEEPYLAFDSLRAQKDDPFRKTAKSLKINEPLKDPADPERKAFTSLRQVVVGNAYAFCCIGQCIEHHKP